MKLSEAVLDPHSRPHPAYGANRDATRLARLACKTCVAAGVGAGSARAESVFGVVRSNVLISKLTPIRLQLSPAFRKLIVAVTAPFS